MHRYFRRTATVLLLALAALCGYVQYQYWPHYNPGHGLCFQPRLPFEAGKDLQSYFTPKLDDVAHLARVDSFTAPADQAWDTLPHVHNVIPASKTSVQIFFGERMTNNPTPTVTWDVEADNAQVELVICSQATSKGMARLTTGVEMNRRFLYLVLARPNDPPYSEVFAQANFQERIAVCTDELKNFIQWGLTLTPDEEVLAKSFPPGKLLELKSGAAGALAIHTLEGALLTAARAFGAAKLASLPPNSERTEDFAHQIKRMDQTIVMLRNIQLAYRDHWAAAYEMQLDPSKFKTWEHSGYIRYQRFVRAGWITPIAVVLLLVVGLTRGNMLLLYTLLVSKSKLPRHLRIRFARQHVLHFAPIFLTLRSEARLQQAWDTAERAYTTVQGQALGEAMRQTRATQKQEEKDRTQAALANQRQQNAAEAARRKPPNNNEEYEEGEDDGQKELPTPPPAPVVQRPIEHMPTALDELRELDLHLPPDWKLSPKQIGTLCQMVRKLDALGIGRTHLIEHLKTKGSVGDCLASKNGGIVFALLGGEDTGRKERALKLLGLPSS